MQKKFFQRVLITALVVIIGISGIGWVTWNLGRVFVGLVSANVPAEEEKEEQTGSEILNLPEISFWTAQVGVYEEKKNALLMAESLKVKGWKAGIIQEEPYILAIGAFGTREKALEQNVILAGQSIEAWVRKESFPALKYKVSGSNVERITALLKTSNSLLGGKEREAVKAELAGDADFFSEGGCPNDFQNLNTALAGILNTDYQEETLEGLYGQDLLDLYVDYKSITMKYLKDYK